MKMLIRIKKIFLRALLYVFNPERCVPRVIHYDGKEWYLRECTKKMFSGQIGTYVHYLRFDKKDIIYLTEVSHKNRATAYRELHRSLWKLGIF